MKIRAILVTAGGSYDFQRELDRCCTEIESSGNTVLDFGNLERGERSYSCLIKYIDNGGSMEKYKSTKKPKKVIKDEKID